MFNLTIKQLNYTKINIFLFLYFGKNNIIQNDNKKINEEPKNIKQFKNIIWIIIIKGLKIKALFRFFSKYNWYNIFTGKSFDNEKLKIVKKGIAFAIKLSYPSKMINSLDLF